MPMLKKNTLIKPPKILESILCFILDYDEVESLPGDFSERYYIIANQSGKIWAIFWYLAHLLYLIPVFVFESLTWSLLMFSNYFKIAVRTLLKQKTYSFINVSGLALGIATCLIIFLYLRAELSYDQFHEHKDRVFRLERQYLNPNGEVKGSYNTLAPSFTLILEKDFPEFENVVRLYHRQTRVKCDNNSFTENNLFFAEADIFEVFTLPMIKGDPATALANPFSVVLSQSTAYKYFRNEDPIGKNLELLYRVYEVTGIIEDSPEYSHVHFDIIPSYLSLKGFGGNYNIKEDYFLGGDNFSDNVTHTYARIAENTNPEILQSKMPDFLDNNLPPVTMNDGSVKKASERLNISLRNITDIHIREDGATDIEPTTDSAYITIFTLVAIFILIIACVNFINLSTARGAKRAKEVGLRTVVGATRFSLITQFIGESVFLSFFAVLLAIVLVALSLSYFENFIGIDIQFNIFTDPFILILLIGIFLTVGFASGIYPAFYLSSFNSATILRGEATKGKKGTSFRKVLVVFQFAISAALIMSLSIIYNQMNFMKNANLGFDKENVLLIPMDPDMRKNYDGLKKKLMQNSNIISVTASKRAPSSFLGDCPGFEFENNGEVQKSTFSLPHNRVWHDFFKTYKMEIIAGRDISQEYPTDDSLAYVLNEIACRKLGIENPNDVLGARFKAFGAVEGKVVGVVKDFNYETLKNDIEPIVTYIASYVNTMAIRIAPGNYQETINYIKNVNSEYNPGATLEYSFLDDRLDTLYKNEAAMMELFGYFSILALIIGCLGLFGLAAFTAEQRTKEIGIRKVLGASVGNITFRLVYQFIRWIIIANIIAIPLIYFYMNDWLNNFAYRTNIEVTVFLISIIVSLVIAFVTVSSQTIKAAIRNPVLALRTE
jgi:putative ABC transport system permease protein